MYIKLPSRTTSHQPNPFAIPSPLIIIYVALLLASLSYGLPSGSREEPSLVKVLLLKNSGHQHELEEASSLSLEQTSKKSLASLTLHQREPIDEEKWTASKRAESDGHEARQPGGRWPRSQDEQGGGSLTEMHLTRVKPTWFNVSSMFKISSDSGVELVKYLFPPQYYLRQAFDSPVLLKTKLGILEGVRSIKFNKDLYTFLSIPYARAPVAELRFKAPEPIEKWDGILQATKWPPFCVQQSMTLASGSSPVHILTQTMSEDCLYLNVWTPSLKFNKDHKRPVMVWLHGGAFQYGGISVDENDGSALALLGDVVVVTLNYRLSALGFLNAQNLKSGPNNVGLLDQRLAMEWVQANIKQFGGDPQQVTLFGESAGGHSLGLHLISPASYPLFKRAILQSGVPIAQLKSYDVNPDTEGNRTEGIGAYMIAKRLNCTETAYDESSDVEEPEFISLDDKTLDCMRTKSSLEIIKAMGKSGNSGYFPTGRDPNGFFPGGSISTLMNPDKPLFGPQKDILIGTNVDEGTFMLHYALPPVFPAKSLPTVSNIRSLKESLRQHIESLIKTSRGSPSSNSSEPQGGTQAHLYSPLLTTSNSVLESFLPKIANLSLEDAYFKFGQNIGRLITDMIFLCPSRGLAQTLSEQGRNVYFYLYEHRSSRSQFHDWFGVTHHDEVEFVFGRPLRMADVFSGRDIEMSQRMIKTWSHFAYTGQPLDQLGLKWPQYGVSDANYMRLSSMESGIGQRYHDKMCNLFDTLIRIHLDDD